MATISPYTHRLASYAHWPHTRPSAPEMAAAGFHNTHHALNPDSTNCHSCNLKMNDWKQHEIPLAEHARRKPNCPFVLQQATPLNSAPAPEASVVVQAAASTAPPIIGASSPRIFMRKFPRTKTPRIPMVVIPKSQTVVFEEWANGVKRRFLVMFEEAQRGCRGACEDLSRVDPNDTFSIEWGNNDVLHRVLAYLFIQHGRVQLHKAKRDMSGTTWISFSRPDNIGTVMALISVARNGFVNRSANITTGLPSSNEKNGPFESGKESAAPSKVKNVQAEGVEAGPVDLVPADDDWERVDGLGEDEWMDVGKDDYS